MQKGSFVVWIGLLVIMLAFFVVRSANGINASTQSNGASVMLGSNGIVSPATMERRADAMRNAGIDVEFHKYQNVGHGFGLGTGTSAEGWCEAAIRFWESHLSERGKK